MNLEDIKITPIKESLKFLKIPDEEYFGDSYKNYISNSRLSLIYNYDTKKVTPEKFFGGFQPIYSNSLDIGSAVHSLVLQPEYFTIVDSVDKPTGKMGAMAEELFKLWKGKDFSKEQILKVAKKVDYYGGKLSDKRISEILEKCRNFCISKTQYLQTFTDTQKVSLYLDPKSRETAYNCIQALQNNKQIQNILHPKNDEFSINPIVSEMEQAILLDIKVEIPDTQAFVLRLKAKLDNYIINKDYNKIQVNDIKTLGRIVSEMDINIEKYHYNREFAFYSFLLSLVAEKFYNIKNPEVSGNYLVVSTIPNYYTKVLPLNKSMFQKGWDEVKYLLRLIAMEVATNHRDFAYKWI